MVPTPKGRERRGKGERGKEDGREIERERIIIIAAPSTHTAAVAASAVLSDSCRVR